MVFEHGKGGVVLLGANDVSGYLRTAEAEVRVQTHDVSVLGDDSINRYTGQFDGNADLDGLFDATYSGIVEGFLASANGEPFTLVPGEAAAVGDPVILGVTRELDYSIGNPVGGMVVATVSLEASGGVNYGELLLPLGAQSSSADGTSVDWAASTAQGGWGIIHCTAFDATSLDVDIEDSPDDSVWATLGSFTQLTAVGSERIEVAAGTTVDRYIRASWTLVGTSATFAVAFARRIVAP